MAESNVRCAAGFNQCKSAVEVFTDGRFERIEAVVTALEEKNSLQFEANRHSSELRNLHLDKRLEVMNEFRSALSDRESSYFTRKEHDIFAKLVEADLRLLREARAEMQGKASQNNLNVTFVIALIGSLLGVAGFVLRLFGK